MKDEVEKCHPDFENNDIFKYGSLKYLGKTL